MRTAVASLFAASVLLASPFAFAEDARPAEAPADAPADAPAPTHWYGYQTLAVDGAALALTIPAMASSSSGQQGGFAIASSLTYGLGGPIVHFSHGAIGKGFANLGLRVGMPLVLGAIGGLLGAAAYHPPPASACNSSSDDFCGLGQALGPIGAIAEGSAIGGLIGIGGAIAVDAAVLAREPVTRHDDSEPAEPRDPPTASGAHFEPTVGLSPERQGGARASVGLRGTF